MATRKPVTISLPPPLVKAVAQLAKRQHQTTSELVRAALLRYLRDAEADAAWHRALTYGRKKAKALGVGNDEDLEALISDLVNDYRHGSRPAAASGRR